jgi:hypothetical protein
MDTSAGHPDHNPDRILNQGLTHALPRSLTTLSSLSLQNALDVIKGFRLFHSYRFHTAHRPPLPGSGGAGTPLRGCPDHSRRLAGGTEAVAKKITGHQPDRPVRSSHPASPARPPHGAPQNGKKRDSQLLRRQLRALCRRFLVGRSCLGPPLRGIPRHHRPLCSTSQEFSILNGGADYHFKGSLTHEVLVR